MIDHFPLLQMETQTLIVNLCTWDTAMKQSSKNVCLVFCLSFQIHSQSILTLLSAFSGKSGPCEPAQVPPVPSDFWPVQPMGDPGRRAKGGRRVKAGTYILALYLRGYLRLAVSLKVSLKAPSVQFFLSIWGRASLPSSGLGWHQLLCCHPLEFPYTYRLVNSPFVNKSSSNNHILSTSSISCWDCH